MKAAHSYLSSLCLSIMSLLCVATLSTAKAATEPAFHPAQSIVEKRLNKIIRAAELSPMDEDLMTGTATNSNDAPEFFTPALLASFMTEEKRNVLETCDGQYLDGQICGIDENPVSCTQDISNLPYLYRTLKEDEHSAILQYHWSDQIAESGGPIYRLVKIGKLWKLDGVRCSDDVKFNMG